jgi:hypothetical protein
MLEALGADVIVEKVELRQRGVDHEGVGDVGSAAIVDAGAAESEAGELGIGTQGLGDVLAALGPNVVDAEVELRHRRIHREGVREIDEIADAGEA